MYYHITSLTNDIIASNLPPELWSEANRCVNVSVSELCPIKNKKKRHGVILSDEIRLYLCTYDENITNKIFKRYQETAAFFGAELIQHKKNITRECRDQVSILKHNISTQNADIVQEFEMLFPQESLNPKDTRANQLEAVCNIVSSHVSEVAKSLYRIWKSSGLIRNEIAVYNMLTSDNPSDDLQILPHQIHKLILRALSPRWIDLKAKNVTVDVRPCNKLVAIDFRTISVALSHMFDNACKYIMPNSTLDIEFKSSASNLLVSFKMISLYIQNNEQNLIFTDNYSGVFPKRLERNGKGKGMWIVKKVMNLNKGDVILEIEAGNEKIQGIYGRYKFTLSMPIMENLTAN